MYIYIVLSIFASCLFYAASFYAIRAIRGQKGFDGEKDYRRLFWLSLFLTLVCAFMYFFSPLPLYEDERAALFWAGIFNAVIMGGIARQEQS